MVWGFKAKAEASDFEVGMEAKGLKVSTPEIADAIRSAIFQYGEPVVFNLDLEETGQKENKAVVVTDADFVAPLSSYNVTMGGLQRKDTLKPVTKNPNPNGAAAPQAAAAR